VVPVWYNRRVFAAAGVTPPTTIEEWFAVCAKLREQGRIPLALGNAQSWPGAFYFVYFATRAGGAEALAAGRFEDEAFVYAGEQVQAMVRAGWFSPGANALSYDDARRQFFAGEAAMLVMGTWLVAQASKEAPELGDDLDCFAFPALGRQAAWDATAVGGVNAAYAVAAGTKAPEDAVALLHRLSDDAALTEWAATGRIPALTREAAAALLPESPSYARILYEATAVQLYYDQYLPPRLATLHKETTQALFALSQTPAAAAAKMAAAAR
jgi:raffinose/stachyose/melibiose transport system substrate-binding protein